MKKILSYLVLLALTLSLGYGQTATKKVALLWDASYGMANKDLKKELDFLDAYFKENPEAEVKLRVFSNEITQEETYKVTKGDWFELKKTVSQIIYDGSSSFEEVFPKDVDEIVLVSNGNETLDGLPNMLFVPTKIISSTPYANTAALEMLALTSGGAYSNLGSSKDGEGLEVETNQLNTVSAAVRTTTNQNSLNPNGEVLDEVLLEAEREQEPEMINTGMQKVDKRKLGYAVEMITSDDIAYTDTDVQQAVKGQFSGLYIQNDTANDDVDLSQFLGRGKNMTIHLSQYGLIVIDGVPITQTDSGVVVDGFGTNDKGISSHIDPSNIATITYLKGLAATNKYGTLGRNGVLLITSKTATIAGGGAQKKKDVVLGTTATYTGDALTAQSLPNTPYINALKTATDVNDAYQIYLVQRAEYGKDPSFFLNVASYFKDWNNPIIVERILSNISEFSSDDTNYLLAQAYKLEEVGSHKAALNVYKRILEQQPDRIQNYRNLALAYDRADMPREALALYQRLHKKQIMEVTTANGLNKTWKSEFKNLLVQNRGKFQVSAVAPEYKNPIKYDTRVVFEWSHPQAQFDLQIVNPQNRFFTWSHTPAGDAARWNREQTEGYGLEEFFMTQSDVGEWLFNVSYLGVENADPATPVYLKITTYKGFGTPQQTKEIKTLMLNQLSAKETVLTVKI